MSCDLMDDVERFLLSWRKFWQNTAVANNLLRILRCLGRHQNALSLSNDKRYHVLSIPPNKLNVKFIASDKIVV